MTSNNNDPLSNVTKYMDEYGLNKRQVLFAIYYDGNATSSARKAGYSSPHVQGSRVLGNASVKRLIDTLTARESTRDNILTREELMQIWSELAADPKARWSDRLKAMDSLGKAHGIFIDKQAIMGQLSVEHLDRLSDAELMAKLSDGLATLASLGLPIAIPETTD
jgi:hypothetical protein